MDSLLKSMLKTASCATIPDLVSQLADNCAGFWRNREDVARCRTYDASLRDLDQLDERVEAQIEGLRTAGNEGWRTVTENIGVQGTGGIFTAAVLAFENCSAHREVGDEIETLLVEMDKPALAMRPISLAMDWIDPVRLPLISERLSANSGHCCAATELMARSRSGQLRLQRAISALETELPLLVRAVCEAALVTGERSLLRPIETHLESKDREVAEIVAQTALTLGSSRARQVLSVRAGQEDLVAAEIAARILFRSLEPRHALAMHRTIFCKTPLTRASVQAAGAAAIRELVPVLLESMKWKALARLAAEMFCTMTGRILGAICYTAPRRTKQMRARTAIRRTKTSTWTWMRVSCGQTARS